MEKMSINRKVLNVQSELKCPKNCYNSFGKYAYRNTEGILEAVKPLLLKEELTLRIFDEIIMVGERFYVKASAIISDGENEIVNTALAREEESKRGMDGSQITGTASSYARKYCLNGLFLIDDTKDADSEQHGGGKFKLSLLSLLEEKKIDKAEFCKQNGLKANSSEDDFKLAYLKLSKT